MCVCDSACAMVKERMFHCCGCVRVCAVQQPRRTPVTAVAPGGASADSPLSKVIRYTAYGSELAEAFRPVISMLTVQALYGITMAYIAGVILNQGRNAAKGKGAGPVAVTREVVHETLFQLIANLLLPTGLVHLIVHHSADLFFDGMGGAAAKWGPTVVGLAVIPFLPLLDPTLEHIIGAVFNALWRKPKVKAA